MRSMKFYSMLLLMVCFCGSVLCEVEYEIVKRNISKAFHEHGLQQRDLQTCWPGVAEARPNPEMLTCCWYEDSTCCSKELNNLIAPIRTVIEMLLKNLGEPSLCFYEIANFHCLYCHPNTQAFISGKPGEELVFALCHSFCLSAYLACKPYFKSFSQTRRFRNATDFCQYLIEGQDSKFSIAMNNRNCFHGVNPQLIENSRCLPTKVASINKPQEAASEGWFTVLLVMGILVALIAGVGTLTYLRRKQRYESPSDAAEGVSAADEELDEIKRS